MGMVLSRRNILAVAAALAARPRRAAAAERALDRLLARRRMVRRFTAAPVTDAVVDRLISTATRAPSAGDTQPWAFVVLREPAAREALARAAHGQSFVAAAPVVIVACADLPRSRGRYEERGDRYALIDVAFASMLLLLAVTEEGLGACFVGAFRDAEVSRVLALPSHVQPVALIPVGHPAESPRGHELRPLREVVHHEKWRGAR